MRTNTYRESDRPRVVHRAHHERNRERVRMRITRGDTVVVVRGDEKGKQGKVLRVYPKTGRLTIEGVNLAKRHRKARRPEEQSGIVDFPAPLHVSNVMLLDPKSSEPTRLRARIDEDGTKERIAVKSGDAIPRTR